ncbi:hypothetical protein ACFV3I_01950 [Microbacterium sp. NPDC059771]|uniref:hypothetical protein n=1 Tax=Microbacterium sp. NPDC059771 TaxID=3346941 RepID=UPI0036465470
MVKEAAVPRRSRRVVLITASVLVAGALFAGGWAAALVFRSPAQIDAAAQPPIPPSSPRRWSAVSSPM